MPREIKQIFEAKNENVALLLDDSELGTIAEEALGGYQSDEESRGRWKERNKEGMRLAMQMSETRDFPFEDSANVMYPLVSTASIQFSARAYPTLIPGWDIVKSRALGKDENGKKAAMARRVETHMNYQLNVEMGEWKDETDILLTVLPITGCCFKETYWSKNLGRNVSSYYNPNDIVMNYMATSMETVPRITKKAVLYPNDIIGRFRAGVFKEFELSTPSETKEEGDQYGSGDTFKPHLFLYQHTWLDLDGDGYAEPYIITIHKDTRQIVRIVPRFRPTDITFNDRSQVQRIKAKTYYTKFGFMPSPDGAIYDRGFGVLLAPINDTVNTTINQLLDAGTMNNSQAGFLGRNIGLGRGRDGGTLRLEPGELRQVNYAGDDIRKNIVMLAEFMKEPSATLFNLLGFMVAAGEKLSSVTELLTGEQSVHNEPATTSMARLEQGLQVFSSIQERNHRSFSREFNLLYDLNSEYLDPRSYYYLLDDPSVEQEALQADYDRESTDLVPVSNPKDVSNAQTLVKAQALYGLKGQGFNDKAIDKRYLEALRIPNPEEILNAPTPQPDPKIVLESEKLELQRDELEFEMSKYEDERIKIHTEAIKNLAEAEAKEIGPQLEIYKAELQDMQQKSAQRSQERKDRLAAAKGAANNAPQK